MVDATLYLSIQLIELQAVGYRFTVVVQQFHERASFGFWSCGRESAASVTAVVTTWGLRPWMVATDRPLLGFSYLRDPVLRPLDNIECRDAVLDLTDPDHPREPEWPDADVIVGNPSFLGVRLLRGYLGDAYVDALFKLYSPRVPSEADYVCYWFEKARAMVAAGRVQRVGLLATQGIRGGANRRVLDRVKETGEIFMARSDDPWVLEGAAVHVSFIAFDAGTEPVQTLDGQPVASINANLTAGLDLTKARPLSENAGIAFQGPVKVGPFEIPQPLALEMLAQPNPHGKSNRDVVRPWVNGLDITRRPRHLWIIDFREHMSVEEAALYEAPFEYVRQHVGPLRAQNRDRQRRENWWRLGRSGGDLRRATAGLTRFIVTPRVAKHRLFAWVPPDTLPDSAVVAIARDDDYTFGVLHSRVHELWARGQGTQLREVESGFRYTPRTTFETFPFPSPTDEQREAIATAAKTLDTFRHGWLNPDGADPQTLRSRTLTNLYNERPTWLVQAHDRLDRAVLAAYGWEATLSDEDVVERLLTINLERSSSYSAQAAIPALAVADSDYADD